MNSKQQQQSQQLQQSQQHQQQQNQQQQQNPQKRKISHDENKSDLKHKVSEGKVVNNITIETIDENEKSIVASGDKNNNSISSNNQVYENVAKDKEYYKAIVDKVKVCLGITDENLIELYIQQKKKLLLRGTSKFHSIGEPIIKMGEYQKSGVCGLIKYMSHVREQKKVIVPFVFPYETSRTTNYLSERNLFNLDKLRNLDMDIIMGRTEFWIILIGTLNYAITEDTIELLPNSWDVLKKFLEILWNHDDIKKFKNIKKTRYRRKDAYDEDTGKGGFNGSGGSGMNNNNNNNSSYQEKVKEEYDVNIFPFPMVDNDFNTCIWSTIIDYWKNPYEQFTTGYNSGNNRDEGIRKQVSTQVEKDQYLKNGFIPISIN